MKNMTLAQLSDTALVAEVARLARSEHEATVALVVHLAELGARKLHIAAGFESLFEYCVLCGAPHNRGYVANGVMLRTSAPTAPDGCR